MAFLGTFTLIECSAPKYPQCREGEFLGTDQAFDYDTSFGLAARCGVTHEIISIYLLKSKTISIILRF